MILCRAVQQIAPDMRLTVWPMTSDEAAQLQYGGGDVDIFATDILDGIGPQLIRRTDGSNLAPDILDPFVFMQFVMGIQGKYSLNGAPFCGNWRLLPAAQRMAGRLGSEALEAELAKAQTELDSFESALLDSYDNADGMKLFRAQPQEIRDHIYHTLDGRFHALVAEGACTFGTSREAHTGGDCLLASLCDWLVQDFPREVLPDAQAVAERLRANTLWACDAVENFEREFTAFYVGVDVYAVLQDHDLRFQNSLPHPFGTPDNGVMTTQMQTTDQRHLLVLWFCDGKMVVDAANLREVGRTPYPEGRPPQKGIPMSQAHMLAYNPKTRQTRRASRFNPLAKFIKPT